MNTSEHSKEVKEYNRNNGLVLKDLKVGTNMFFKNEKLPMKLKALGNRFGVCVRKLHGWHDLDLLHFEVKRGAYFSFKEAYKALKDDLVYSCLDFQENKKAPHNFIFNNWDFHNQKDIDDLLNSLEDGSVELSKRNYDELNIDWKKTKIKPSVLYKV